MDENTTPELRFDGDNSYPDCKACGKCCEYMYMMAISEDDFRRMESYVKEHDIKPIDYDRKCCIFRHPEGKCMIWEARPQLCRLHHCQVSRFDVVKANPGLMINEDLWMVDLYDVFLHGDMSDPRTR